MFKTYSKVVIKFDRSLLNKNITMELTFLFKDECLNAYFNFTQFFCYLENVIYFC